MDKKLIDSYLENIAELVVDEDKIVTYKSLSRSLGIHVNTAKQLLYTYLTQQKIKNAFPTSATYLLAGKLADGSFNITIVNENDLESTYPKFVEITSEHVYSVQKGKNVKEINMLCAVDKEMPERKSLVITSSKCVSKSKDDVKKKPDTKDQENKEILKKAFGVKQEITKKVESPKKEEIVKKESPKKVSPKKQKEKSQGGVKKPAGNLANMFAKVAQKNAEKPKNVKKSEEKECLISNAEVEVVKSETGKSEPKTEGKSSEGSKNIRGREEVELSSDEDFVVVKSKKNKKASPVKKKGSKRKRIRTGSDSNDSESSDVELPETQAPEEELESILPSAILEDEGPSESQVFNKRKKRKIVDKTVMNEDGYLETRKEEVWGTDSEEEEEPKKEEKTKQMAKPKPATGNAGKKQSSLLTFFKKS